jgi:hypothetical protein
MYPCVSNSSLEEIDTIHVHVEQNEAAEGRRGSRPTEAAEGRRGSRPTAPWQAVQAIEKHDVTHRCPDW